MRTINNSRGEQVRVPTYRVSTPYEGTENPPELTLAIDKIVADLQAQMTPQQAAEDPFLEAIAADHLFIEEVRRVPERFSLKNIVARVKGEARTANRNLSRVHESVSYNSPEAVFGFVFPNAQLNEAGQMTFKDEHNYPDIRRSLIPDCGGYAGSGLQMFRPNDSRMLFFVPISVLDVCAGMKYLQTHSEYFLFYEAHGKYTARVEREEACRRSNPLNSF